MNSLFIKIFLWFWLAMVLVVAALLISVLVTQSQTSRQHDQEMDRKFSPLLAEHAAKLYEDHGTAGLREFLLHFPTPGDAGKFFFDEQGREILGGAPSPDVDELRRKAAQTSDTQILISPGHHFVAQPAIGPTGRSYVLVMDMRPPGRAELFRVRPDILAIRVLAAVIVAGLVCFWLARYITAPVTRLRAATRSLAEGNLSARVGSGLRRRDELADLGRDFDHMAERLEALMASQRRLMVDISHELRSPLARLSVALGLAWKHATPPIEPNLDRIERETVRLNDMIGTLLSLARLESGVEPRGRDTVQLDELLREIAGDANFEAQPREVRVEVLRADPCAVIGNDAELRSAIENVVRNAVRYTSAATTVEVSLEKLTIRGAEHALIRVRDHGEGVPPESIENLFRPFYRVADARDRGSGGTGLGLAITATVIRRHGGSCTAQNDPAGGLVVELQLPLGAPAAAQTPPTRA